MGAARRRSQRLYLFEQQKGRCYLCGEEMVLRAFGKWSALPSNYATFDHVIPKASGGRNVSRNQRLACRLGNKLKGSRDVREYLQFCKDRGISPCTGQALGGFVSRGEDKESQAGGISSDD